MQILFTTSNSLLSRLIRRVTKEPVSHCAIAHNNWVIHSNLLGVHMELASTFTKHSKVVHSVQIPENMDKLMHVMSQYDQRPYDFGALLYLGLRFCMPFLPAKNLWQTTGMFLCTEWVTEFLFGGEDHTITPYQLYLRLKGASQENV